MPTSKRPQLSGLQVTLVKSLQIFPRHKGNCRSTYGRRNVSCYNPLLFHYFCHPKLSATSNSFSLFHKIPNYARKTHTVTEKKTSHEKNVASRQNGAATQHQQVCQLKGPNQSVQPATLCTPKIHQKTRTSFYFFFSFFCRLSRSKNKKKIKKRKTPPPMKPRKTRKKVKIRTTEKRPRRSPPDAKDAKPNNNVKGVVANIPTIHYPATSTHDLQPRYSETTAR